jgi:acyl carrier protein
MSRIEDQVARIIVEALAIDADRISPSSRFREDLEADSLEVVELIMSVEEEFGVEVPDEIAETVRTVGDLIALIKAEQDA